MANLKDLYLKGSESCSELLLTFFLNLNKKDRARNWDIGSSKFSDSTKNLMS